MIIKKRNISNFAFIVLLALLIFTPVGFHARVIVSRVLSFSPSALHEDNQATLSDYNWKLSKSDGETLDFKNLKGEVILVNYWATWCPPCVAEMPSLQDLYGDYGDKVTFIMVAHDEPAKVSSFLNKKNYTIPVYFENSRSPKRLSTESIPATFVINRKGKIVVKKIGAANWNSKTTRELLDGFLAE